MKSYMMTSKFKTMDAAVKFIMQEIKDGRELDGEKAELTQLSVYKQLDYSLSSKPTKKKQKRPSVYSVSMSWKAGNRYEDDFLD